MSVEYFSIFRRFTGLERGSRYDHSSDNLRKSWWRTEHVFSFKLMANQHVFFSSGFGHLNWYSLEGVFFIDHQFRPMQSNNLVYKPAFNQHGFIEHWYGWLNDRLLGFRSSFQVNVIHNLIRKPVFNKHGFIEHWFGWLIKWLIDWFSIFILGQCNW